MAINVIKRDGAVVPFDFNKIKNAVNKAFQAVYESDAPEDFINYLEVTSSTFEDDMSVEDIQKFVIYSLGEFKYYDVQIAYTEYRALHKIHRDNDAKLLEQIKEKLEATNVENQNANLDERSFGGRMGEANRVVMKDYALNYCMSEMAKNNHLNNEIYIHDLDSYAVGMHNCLSIPFDDLLANGFNTRQTDVRPAGSVNTAFQLIAVIFQLQSLQQFGGVSATHIDWTMVPYVRLSFFKHFNDGLKYIENGTQYVFAKDKIKAIPLTDIFYADHNDAYTYAMDMTNKEIHQAVEALYHNLNTLQSRSGNQLPFTSINYGTCTLEEGRMVTKALLEVSIEGLGKLHKTPIFPCGIFQCMKGVNRKEGEPNYDLFKLALKSTSRRLYPNYANVD